MKSKIVFLSTLALALASHAKADYCPTPRTSFSHSLNVKVSFDKSSKTYTYLYAIKNDRSSQTSIIRLFLGLEENPPLVSSENKRWHPSFTSADSEDPSFFRWYTSFVTDKPNSQSAIRIPDAAIRPGQALGGLSIQSPHPPVATRYFIDGFQDIPSVQATNDNPDPDLNCPEIDTENSIFRSIVTGMTVGPKNPNVISVKMRLRKNDGRERCSPFEPKNPKGQINLVVFSSKEFDATQIDMNSVKFGPDEVAPLSSKAIPSNFGSFAKDEEEEWERHHEAHQGKVDGGQRRNLMMTFDVASLGIQCVLDKALFLSAKTVDGKSIFGGVSTKTTGCDVKKPGKRKSKGKNRESRHE